MKRMLTLSLLVCSLLLTACQDAKNDKTMQNAIPNDQWGITLYAEDVTPTGMTLKIEQFGGNPSGELQTGADYFLETKDSDVWQEVKTKTGEPLVFNAIAYRIKKNEVTAMQVDWQYGYGELKPGNYRLKKTIMDFRETGDYDEATYEVYFTVD